MRIITAGFILSVFVFIAFFFGSEAAPQVGARYPERGNGRMTIVLDPGHGGHDTGAVGPSGTMEKVVSLELAIHLKKALQSRGFSSVRLTRDGDYRLDLEKRAALANQLRAAALVSIHAGGSFHPGARGLCVHYWGRGLLSPPSKRPNPEGGELVSWDDIQTTHASKSKELAESLRRHLCAHWECAGEGFGHAPLALLQGLDMPAVLLEIGYLTHPAEENRLQDMSHLARMAERIAVGIEAFLAKPTDSGSHRGLLEEDIWGFRHHNP